MYFNLSELGLLKVSGQGAKQLLQGQLTCNMDEVTSGQTRLGAHCNPQGRIISFFRVVCYQNDYLMLMHRSLLPLTIQALQKYAPFFKAELSDISNQFTLIGTTSAPNFPLEIDQIQANTICIAGNIPRYIQLLAKNSDHADLKPYSDWHAIDISSNIPGLYPETSALFLPHELHLPQLNAVSFTKGCYTGQEIIARMQYRGKLKAQLLPARIITHDKIMRGSDIYTKEQAIGKIVDYCQMNEHEYLVLAVTQQTNDVYLDLQHQISLDFIL